MDNYNKTIEYETLMKAFRSHKFTKNDIKSFVHKVFSMYERATCENEYLPAEAFDKIVDENIYVDFPDYKIRNKKEFMEWYKWIHSELNSDDHEIKKVNVEYLSNWKYQAQFFVRWRADFKDGRYTDLLVEQLWIMREEEDKTLPIIEHYIVGLANNIDANTFKNIK